MLRSSAILAALLLAGCAGAPRRAAAVNPVAWPAKLLAAAGWSATGTAWPILRETGWLLSAAGELAEALWQPSTSSPKRGARPPVFVDAYMGQSKAYLVLVHDWNPVF